MGFNPKPLLVEGANGWPQQTVAKLWLLSQNVQKSWLEDSRNQKEISRKPQTRISGEVTRILQPFQVESNPHPYLLALGLAGIQQDLEGVSVTSVDGMDQGGGACVVLEAGVSSIL